MVYANERAKIMKSQLDMKSQLEETKQEIIELLVRYGFPKFGGVNIYPQDRIYVESKRDDIPEDIFMVIRRSEHHWYLTMSGDDKTCDFKDDKEKMLESIENKLQEFVKCCG